MDGPETKTIAEQLGEPAWRGMTEEFWCHQSTEPRCDVIVLDCRSEDAAAARGFLVAVPATRPIVQTPQEVDVSRVPTDEIAAAVAHNHRARTAREGAERLAVVGPQAGMVWEGIGAAELVELLEALARGGYVVPAEVLTRARLS